MNVKAFVLAASAALLGIAAGPKEAKLTEGMNPGDLAPRIEIQGNDAAKIHFQNPQGTYTLLNFWAAYDAESRIRNILLWNKVNKLGAGKVAFRSVSFDTKESIFIETVRADRLDASTQLWDSRGVESDYYREYGLDKGFKNFLIDSKGVIVAANLTPDRLAEMLKKI